MTYAATSARWPTYGGPPPILSTLDPSFVTNSAKYREALDQLDRFAKHDSATVLIEGESGTGKSFFARHLHRCSPRADRVYRQVLMSALEDSLAGSDLFGHVQGAFTDARKVRQGHFASANGGTVFLDEIHKTSLAIQGKLLGVLEHGDFYALGEDRPTRVDVRIVAATNVSLEECVTRERFLPDLLARFGCFRVRIPPLRERREDIAALAAQIVATRANRFAYDAPPSLDSSLVRTLQERDWPGNVRQLDNVLQRMLVDAEGATLLTLDHCAGVAEYVGLALPTPVSSSAMDRTVELFAETNNVSEVARQLGVDRSTVQRRLRRASRQLESNVLHAAPQDAASHAARGTRQGSSPQSTLS
jgi:DNA-binding NtrC family response regulator